MFVDFGIGMLELGFILDEFIIYFLLRKKTAQYDFYFVSSKR